MSVVVNVPLKARYEHDSHIAAVDPLHRTWAGFDHDATPQDLWEHNRGWWNIAPSKFDSIRIATFTYRRAVVLVARVDQCDLVRVPSGEMKVAFCGNPLSPGDPVYEKLIGYEMPRARAHSYPDIPGIEELIDQSESQQGWQSDPIRRRKVELACQHRLMDHYRGLGWTVEDTHIGHPYDALATRGTERIYLEAKGTETDGVAVLVTPGEVNHARTHSGSCVMGIWSGIRFTPDDQVDPTAGHFRLIPFDPDEGVLTPRSYEWRP